MGDWNKRKGKLGISARGEGKSLQLEKRVEKRGKIIRKRRGGMQ